MTPITEEEASKRVCPFSRGHEHVVTRGVGWVGADDKTGCIGSACMLWKTTHRNVTREEYASMPRLSVERPLSVLNMRRARFEARIPPKECIVEVSGHEIDRLRDGIDKLHGLIFEDEYEMKASIPGEVGRTENFRLVLVCTNVDEFDFGAVSGVCGAAR